MDTLRIKPGDNVKLSSLDPDFTGPFKDHDAAREAIKANEERLNKLQETLYAEHKRALLICLQARDAGGKDGVITHVLGAMNPQGCRVYSFKKPAGAELEHDYLWRTFRDLPGKGEVAIFNRSHYEEVLVPRVHKLLPKDVLERRYGQINDVERYLSQNGTHILKFYLHISKDEQLRRFKDRLDDPSKHWKLNPDDYREREYWGEYTTAFEAMLSRCSTKDAPWFVIPANHKWFRNYVVSQIVADYMEAMRLKFPPPQADMAEMRKAYQKAKKGA